MAPFEVRVNRLVRRILRGEVPIRGQRLDVAITAILLASDEEAEANALCVQGFNEGKYRVDTELVMNVFNACDEDEQLELACSRAVDLLPYRELRAIFDKVYARTDLSNRQRTELVRTLEFFLWRQPRYVPRFTALIKDLLRSRYRDLACRALNLAGMLRRIDEADLAIVRRALTSKDADRRINALAAFANMAMSFEKIDSRLKTFLASNELRTLTRQLRRSDPDESVRVNARCLQGWLRTALNGRPPPRCCIQLA
jgi:hypothetical protein